MQFERTLQAAYQLRAPIDNLKDAAEELVPSLEITDDIATEIACIASEIERRNEAIVVLLERRK